MHLFQLTRQLIFQSLQSMATGDNGFHGKVAAQLAAMVLKPDEGIATIRPHFSEAALAQDWTRKM